MQALLLRFNVLRYKSVLSYTHVKHMLLLYTPQVWCPMTPEFYSEYLDMRTRKRKV